MVLCSFDNSQKENQMTVSVTGATRFIGRRLVQRLRADNHSIHVLKRSKSKAEQIFPGKKVCLIGKGGQVIQKLRNENNAQIRVINDSLPICDLALSHDELLQAFQKGSPLVQKVSREIAKLRRTETPKAIGDWWFQRQTTSATSDVLRYHLTVYTFCGLFMITGVSFASAFTVYLIPWNRDQRQVVLKHFTAMLIISSFTHHTKQ